MEVTEIISRQEYSVEDIVIDMYAIYVHKTAVTSAMEVLNASAPLSQFGLDHLKRIQSQDRRLGNDFDNDTTAGQKSDDLRMLLCPVAHFDLMDESIKQLGSRKQVVQASRLKPITRDQFLLWGKLWPINYHINQQEKDRQKGLTAEDMQQMERAHRMLWESSVEKGKGTADGVHCSPSAVFQGGLMINPDNGRVVMTSWTASEYLFVSRKRGLSSSQQLLSQALHTPTMLCIEGVAALMRGDMKNSGESPPLPTEHSSSDALCLWKELFSLTSSVCLLTVTVTCLRGCCFRQPLSVQRTGPVSVGGT